MTSKTKYLYFRTSDVGPFQTVEVPCVETPYTPRKGITVSGYGKGMPTRFMVKWAGRWYRVRVACWANAGTAYIGKPGAWLATVQD